MWRACGVAETSRVLVLCATNRPEALDEAVLRRLPSQYKIPMPNMEGRKSILKVLFQPDRTTGVTNNAPPFIRMLNCTINILVKKHVRLYDMGKTHAGGGRSMTLTCDVVQEGGLEMEDAEIEEIAEAAKGLSGSDLKEVCSQAQMRAVVDLLKGEKEREGRREEWRVYDEELSVQVRGREMWGPMLFYPELFVLR